MEFKATIKNIGNIPATNVQAWVSMACGTMPFREALEKIPVHREEFGNSLFPNDIFEQNLFGRIVQEEIDGATLNGPLSQVAGIRPNRKIGVAAVASVTYEFAGRHGKTTKAYSLYGPGSAGVTWVVDFDKLPISKDRITLLKAPLYDTAT